MKPFLLQHLERPQGRFPVWMMRQAGRYLPEYRRIREKHTFWEMVFTPELAAEVTLLPLQHLEVDALILFSDILTLPKGLGFPIAMVESQGPVLEKPLQAGDFSRFSDFDAQVHCGAVLEALRLLAARKAPELTLLGFAGAPWTVCCYLLEGKLDRKFGRIKPLLYENPQALASCLQQVAQATVSYLKAQHQAGAQMVQLFDTWLFEMPFAFYEKYYLPLVQELLNDLRKAGIPTVFYAQKCPWAWKGLAPSCDVLGVDSTLSLQAVEQLTGGKTRLQGNLDPMVLFCSQKTVQRQTRELVQAARQLHLAPILNLGHGILPKTPLENAQCFVAEARQPWS